MIILDIAIIMFICLETMNIAIIYFAPNFKYGNGVAIFKFWEDSKSNEEAHLFAKYMANWVAGSKLIFIVLLIVILFTGDESTKLFALIAMIPAIATYYVKLHPIIKKLDAMGQIKPQGYSKMLIFMISGFITLFTIALIAYFATQ